MRLLIALLLTAVLCASVYQVRLLWAMHKPPVMCPIKMQKNKGVWLT